MNLKPQEKAIELQSKFKDKSDLVCDEMINSVNNPDWCTDFIDYWKEVKVCIKALKQ
jgi:hypothetical protein